ncbi:tyrosine-type recombinase/integrase [Novosphingobium terrae]|uniref:tyrosine-type recombinase/integrase n=1 Tax=Novosphingobium terrae TaxID=2726189 RepID=UPI00197DF59A|nr:site-specific integrase [Novosphingobium terrae]
MAKTLSEAPITTRNARAKLEAGVHWRGIDPEVHLGYRKGKRGGGWLVRWRNGAGYCQEALGTADDHIAEGTLDFAAAVRAAREKVVQRRRDAKATADGPAQTVRTAVVDYLAAIDARYSARAGRSVRSSASYRLGVFLLGTEAKRKRKAIAAAPLADVALHDLDEPKLKGWVSGLPGDMAASSRRRLVNDLRAALNTAAKTHRCKLPENLPIVIRHGLELPCAIGDHAEAEETARENQILSDTTIGSVIAAAQKADAEKGWDGDLVRMIIVLAATGARFSQVARIRVRDVQIDRRRIMVPTSRKGAGSKNAFTPVPIGQDVLDAVLPVISGRPNDAPLLERPHYKQAKGAVRWTVVRRGCWGLAHDLTTFWAAIRKEAGLDASVAAYSLRHSSIVRGIRNGLPIRLVAALHDTSVAMIERTYSRWIADGLDDLAAKAVVPLVPLSGQLQDKHQLST